MAAKSSFYPGGITTPGTPSSAPTSFYNLLSSGLGVLSFNDRGGVVVPAVGDYAAFYQPLDAELTSWAALTRASGFDTFATTPSSANLRSLLTDETGTGAAVFGTSPTLTTSALLSSGFVFSWASGLITMEQLGTTILFSGANYLMADWNDNTAASANVVFRKSRGTPGVKTIVASGDNLGRFIAQGYNGSGYDNAALISFDVDGTPGASADMPGRIAFYTSPDGSATLAEAMRIASTKRVTIYSTEASTGTTDGALVVSGGGAFAGTVNVGGNTYVLGDVSIGINAFGSYPLYIYRDGNGSRLMAIKNANTGTSARAGVRVLNDSDLYYELIMHSSAYTGLTNVALFNTSTGVALQMATASTVRLTVGATGAVTFGTTAPVTISNTTAPNSHTAGALIVLGGAGFTKDVWLGPGTTTIAPLTFTAGGNLMTTARAGSFEFDGTCFYATPVVSTRGIITSSHIITLSANQTGTNVATAQPWFPGGGTTGMTLPATTAYFFEGVLVFTKTAGTTARTVSLLFGGTATITSIMYDACVRTEDAAAPTLGATNNLPISVATATVVTASSASANQSVSIRVRGLVRLNGAGTFIPQFQYSAAPGGAPTVLANSWFRMWAVGASSVSDVGSGGA